jgi:hypothetical protein
MGFCPVSEFSVPHAIYEFERENNSNALYNEHYIQSDRRVWPFLTHSRARFDHGLFRIPDQDINLTKRLRTDDTNKKIDAWIDIYILAYFHRRLYK